MNSLLAYLSIKGDGGMADFAVVCRTLGLSAPWDCLQAMSDLGHVEFSWFHPSGWNCAPAMLSRLPGVEPAAVLCGARSRQLLEALQRYGLTVDSRPQDGGPDVWTVRSGSDGALREAAMAVHVQCPGEAPAWSLAKALPLLEQYLFQMSTPVPLPAPYRPHLWVPGVGQFVSRPTFAEDGLWWYEDRRLNQRRCYIYKSGSQAWQVGDYGGFQVWLRSRGQVVVAYDESSRTLVWQSRLRLPRLHARALTLCSGRLPVHIAKGLQFADIPRSVAAVVAGRIGLTAEEVSVA